MIGSVLRLPATRSNPQSHEAGTRRLRILLAEDSPANVVLMKAYLREQAVDLEIVENGKLAFDRVCSAQFDLIFMDLQMPEMDGYTATRGIRRWEQEHSRPTLPIIALTARALPAEAAKSHTAGCTSHLTKPIQKQTILEALARFVR